jgi:hypothetical protein
MNDTVRCRVNEERLDCRIIDQEKRMFGTCVKHPFLLIDNFADVAR